MAIKSERCEGSTTSRDKPAEEEQLDDIREEGRTGLLGAHNLARKGVGPMRQSAAGTGKFQGPRPGISRSLARRSSDVGADECR